MSKNQQRFKLSTRYPEQSRRQLRISRAIHVLLLKFLQRGVRVDDSLNIMSINITQVSITNDFRIVNCFFSLLNTHLSVEKITKAWERSNHSIRNYITNQLNLKYSPEIRIFYDNSYNHKNTINQLLTTHKTLD